MNESGNPAREIFDRQLIRERRHRVAANACAAEFLLANVAEDFSARLSIIKRDFPLTLNLGAHHGVLGRHLASIAGITTIIAMDDAPALLAQCDPPHLIADEEALPFAPGSLDLIVSGLKLQFANDLPGALIQARHALKPDGLFLAAVLGPDTLKELHEAFFLAEEERQGGASPRVAPFIDVRQAGALLQRAGFALPVTDSEVLEVTYQTPLDLMRDLKAMGASNPLKDRLRKPMDRGTLMRAAEIYQEKFTNDAGRVVATFEIVTLTGWSPHESQQKPLKPGSAKVSLASVLKPRSSHPDENT